MPIALSTSATPPSPPSRPKQRPMNNRDIETRLARATLAALVFYFPIETWASWGHDYWLLNPFYLIDLIAMVLLLYGATRSLRARPRPAPGALCAAHGWAAGGGGGGRGGGAGAAARR